MKKKNLLGTSLVNREIIEVIIKKNNLTDDVDSYIDELENLINQNIKHKLKEIKNKSRIIKNDLTKVHVSANDVLTKEDFKKLPKWVIDDIDNASIIGSSRKVIQISNGKKYHLDNPLNSLSGGEWTYFLNSVINTRFSTNGDDSFAHHIRKIHPSPKPPQLTKQIIEFFTKEGELVFDYFMGVGGTLIGASLCNRDAIGIDLNQTYIDAYKEASNYLKLKVQETVCDDSLKILSDKKRIEKILNGREASLILIDPPYGDMMSRIKTGESTKNKKDNSPTPYTDLTTDLGNMDSNDFFVAFKESVVNSSKILKKNGHLVVFIKDLQPKGKELNLLHSDLIHLINKIDDFYYLGTKIWADQGVNLYPYGYPYAYVSNQIHQYILIFKKK